MIDCNDKKRLQRGQRQSKMARQSAAVRFLLIGQSCCSLHLFKEAKLGRCCCHLARLISVGHGAVSEDHRRANDIRKQIYRRNMLAPTCGCYQSANENDRRGQLVKMMAERASHWPMVRLLLFFFGYFYDGHKVTTCRVI